MNGANRGLFFRLSEALEEDPTVTKATLCSGWMHGIHEIEDEVNQSYNGYHQFDWVRPRKTWLDAKCPVYIDFGDEHLVKLDTYDDSGLKCIRLVSKRKFFTRCYAGKKCRNYSYSILSHQLNLAHTSVRCRVITPDGSRSILVFDSSVAISL